MDKSAIRELEKTGIAAKSAARRLAYLSTDIKNRALLNIADDLIARKSEILAANKIDYQKSKSSGLSAALLDRLMLNGERLQGMASDVRAVAALPDPSQHFEVGDCRWSRFLSSRVGRRRTAAFLGHLFILSAAAEIEADRDSFL